MFNYIIRRLLLMIPTLIGITLVVFFVMALSPGGLSARQETDQGLSPEGRKALEDYYNRRYGLNNPKYVQYAHWLNHISPIGFKDHGIGFPSQWNFGLKTPDFGDSSMTNRPVLDVMAEALPVTLLLNLITIPIVYSISIFAGIYAARHRGKTFDHVSGTTFLALWSLPTIWVGVMLLGFFCNETHLKWFPTAGLHDLMASRMRFLPSFVDGAFDRGNLFDFAWHLVLPIICLTYGGFAFLSKLMRATILENLSADFARTARSKGLSESAILFRHVLGNSLVPLITVAASILPALLGGSVIVERIFSIQGMGRLMIEAIFQRDRELVMGQTVIVSVISLLCLIVADVCYAIVDPRVSYE